MITVNKDVKKASKSQAFDLIKTLKEGGQLSEIELDSLIKYFAPAMPTKPKNAFQWVAKAVAKKDARKYLSYVYVTEEGEAQATDGCRVHRAFVDGCSPGYYCPKTGVKTDYKPDYAKFPDIDRVMPDFPSKEDCKLSADDLTQSLNDKGEAVYDIDPGLFNAQYVDQALCGGSFALSEFNDIETVEGYNEFGRFKVMGMKN